jgi:hypothetical protein
MRPFCYVDYLASIGMLVWELFIVAQGAGI